MQPCLRTNETLSLLKMHIELKIFLYMYGTYRLVKKFEDDSLDICHGASINNRKPTSVHNTHNSLDPQDTI